MNNDSNSSNQNQNVKSGVQQGNQQQPGQTLIEFVQWVNGRSTPISTIGQGHDNSGFFNAVEEYCQEKNITLPQNEMKKLRQSRTSTALS